MSGDWKINIKDNGAEFVSKNKRYFKRFAEKGTNAVRQEMKLMVRLADKITPPESLGQGQRAVDRDLRRAIQPLNIRGFRGEGKWKIAMRKAIRNKNYEACQKLLDQSKHSQLKDTKVVPFTRQIHIEARNKHGRVERKWSRLYTLDTPEWAARLKMLKGRVGHARGGWATAMKTLGNTVKSFANRHSSKGSYNDKLLGLFGDVSATNRSAWAGQGESARTLNAALRLRAGILLRKVAFEEKLAQEVAFQ